MTIKFEVELEIDTDQASITQNEIDIIIGGILDVIPGGFSYGDDEMIIVERTTISRIE